MEDSNAKLIQEILSLKRRRNAIILAHNYQLGEVQDIADFVGDSLELSQTAAKTDADVIVFCGVHFMAETAKLLNPDCKVLIPDLEAGCSLSESITVEDVRALKKKHPGVPVVCYVNTTAAIKAESDICCTSGNAVKVVEQLEGDAVIFIPDEYLGGNVAKQVKKNERILVMFSGIAPYPVVFAKNTEAKKIVGVEWNPTAHKFAEKNIIINKVQDKVEVIKGDVRKIVPKLKKFDRIVRLKRRVSWTQKKIFNLRYPVRTFA